MMYSNNNSQYALIIYENSAYIKFDIDIESYEIWQGTYDSTEHFFKITLINYLTSHYKSTLEKMFHLNVRFKVILVSVNLNNIIDVTLLNKSYILSIKEDYGIYPAYQKILIEGC